MTENGLVTVLKDRFNQLSYEIIDEDLTANDTNYKRYNSANLNWLSFPAPKIRFIDSNGIETAMASTSYAINSSEGYITFTSARASTDTVRADYSFFPFTDAQLLAIVQGARKQIQVLTFRTIDANDINANYQEAILKRCYTLALREMQFPATKYFAISVGGRAMDKSTQVTNLNAMIESNEKDLLVDINAIRYFDRTNVIT